MGADVTVGSFHVTLEGPPGIRPSWPVTCPPEFDYPSVSTRLAEGEGAAFFLNAIRPCHTTAITKMFKIGSLPASLDERLLMKATVLARGRRAGVDVVSEPFEFPIRVCYGCLQTGYNDAEFAQFNFPRIPLCRRLAGNPYLGNPCNPAQDFGPILCCALDDQARDIECPGRPRWSPDAGSDGASDRPAQP